MTSERDTLRLVGEWLAEGRTALPDHVLDAVLEQIPAKPQRRPRGPLPRIPDVTRFARYLVAAAAAVAIAIVGVNVLQAPGQLGRGGPAPGVPSPSPSSTPSPSPSPSAVGDVPIGPLDPGRYAWPWEGGQVSFAIVDGGWTANAAGIVKGPDTPGEHGLDPYLPGTPDEITHVYADACRSEGQLQPIGPTVDDLVEALERQGGTEVVRTGIPRDRANGLSWQVTGWRLEIRQAPGLDRTTCRHGADGPLQVWADAAENRYFALGVGHWGVVYVFDLDGRRLVFGASLGPEATEQAAMQLDDIVWSLDFGPPASAPLPARSLPGTRASPAGEYGWEGGPRDRAWMHKVDEGGERVALIFAVGPDCLAAIDEQGAVPVRVAGFDGVFVEPYQPPVPFGSADGDEITRAHALAVGDRTLCVFQTWHPTTTDEELAAAEVVLDTLRAVAMGEDRIRITFTLDEGWDTG